MASATDWTPSNGPVDVFMKALLLGAVVELQFEVVAILLSQEYRLLTTQGLACDLLDAG
jgi:peptide subunit release factor RF-3